MRGRLDTILTSDSWDQVRLAGQELCRHLEQNPSPPSAPSSAHGRCVIAAEDKFFEDLFNSFLPSEWKPHTTVLANDDVRFTDVIRVVRDTLPALLCIHSNLVRCASEAFAAYVAVSPATRYLILNSNLTLEDIEEFRRTYRPLQISVSILNLPFTPEEFAASLQSASGGALPKLADPQQG